MFRLAGNQLSKFLKKITNLRMVSLLSNPKTMWKEITNITKPERMRSPTMIIMKKKIVRSPGKLATLFQHSSKPR